MIEIIRLSTDNVSDLIQLGIKQDEFQCIEEIDFWSEKELYDWLSSSKDFSIGLFEEQSMIGYCLSHYNPSLNKISLENIYIIKSYRNQGLAKKLLQEIINLYKQAYPNQASLLRFVALAQSDNLESINLARSCGFSIGETMVWMQK